MPVRTAIVLMTMAALLTACSGTAGSPSVPATVAPTAGAQPTTAAPVASPTAAAAATSGATPAAKPAAGLVRYTLVADKSQATYAVKETFVNGARLATARGTTSIEGTLVLDGASRVVAEDSKLTVDLRLLKSDDSRRDNRLKTQWLESNTYPLAEFRPTGLEGSLVEGQETTLKLSGRLKIRTAEQPVTFDVKAQLKDGTVSGTGTTSFKMSSFGVQPPDIAGMLKAEDDVALEITFVATRAA